MLHPFKILFHFLSFKSDYFNCKCLFFYNFNLHLVIIWSDLSFQTLAIIQPWKSLKMSFSLLDGFKSRSECHSAIRGDGMWCLFLIFASVFGAIKAFKLGNRILQFMDIKNFYHEALGISSGKFSCYLIGWLLLLSDRSKKSTNQNRLENYFQKD